MSVIPSGEHVIAVFGSPALGNGQPRGPVRRRLQCARGLALEDPCALVIVSGGAVLGPIEAEVMRDWLVERGIGADRIVTEPRARNTFENASFVARELEEVGAAVVTLVTERFHLWRSARVLRWAVEDAGLAVAINPVGANDGLSRVGRVGRAIVEGVKLGIDWGRRRMR